MSLRPQEKRESVPEAPPAVHAAGSAMLDLQMAVQEGLERRPGQKFEVGGLVLGSANPIRIESVQPMPIEHRFGPSFWLSSADVTGWKQTIAQIGESGTERIIGHFRSQRTGGSELREAAPQDVDHAIADLLNIQDPLLVLVPLATNDIGEVQVYRRSGGLWRELQRGPVESLRQIPVPPPRMAPAPAVVPIDTRRPRRGRFLIAALAAAVVLLLLALIVWRRPALPAGAAGPIGLTAHATTGGIALSWNRDSSIVRQSNSGNLTIRDGDARQQLAMSHNQLLDGSAVYVPKTAQVDFRLEVYSDADHFAGESLSVSTGIKAPPAATAPASPQQASVSPPQSPAVRRPRSESVHEESSSAAFHEVAPIQRSNAAAPAPIAAPPSLSAPPAPASSIGEAQRALSAPVQLPPRPSTAPRTQPNVVTPIDFVAPMPSRKVNPSISPETRSVLDRMMAFDKLDKLSVDIRVDIDPSGSVSSAAPAGTLNAPQRLLAPNAIQAARLWRFQPALRNGKPVRSDYIVTFVFSRK